MFNLENFDTTVKIIDAVLFVMLGLAWSKKGLSNFLVKSVLVFAAIANVYVVLHT
jgi:hypothetical protein